MTLIKRHIYLLKNMVKYCKDEKLLDVLVVLEAASVNYSPVVSQVISQELSQNMHVNVACKVE